MFGPAPRAVIRCYEEIEWKIIPEGRIIEAILKILDLLLVGTIIASTLLL